MKRKKGHLSWTNFLRALDSLAETEIRHIVLSQIVGEIFPDPGVFVNLKACVRKNASNDVYEFVGCSKDFN